MLSINPQTYPQKLWVRSQVLISTARVGYWPLFFLSLAPVGGSAGDLAPTANRPVQAAESLAGEYLEFLSVEDGHCQNLSQGGQLLLLKSTHPAKKIKFRLERYFAGVRQPGLVQDVIDPGSQPVRLGCTRVDNREQNWKVRLATFLD